MSGDSAEALRRFGEIAARPLALRSHAVGEILAAAMETEKLGERMQLAKVALSLVPARVVSRQMLCDGIAAFSSAFDDLRLDAGKSAVSDVADVLSTGVVEGTLKSAGAGLVTASPALSHVPAAVEAAGYVPVDFVHKDIAREVNRQANGRLDRAMPRAGSKVARLDDGGGDAPAPAPAPAAPAPAPRDAAFDDDVAGDDAPDVVVVGG